MIRVAVALLPLAFVPVLFGLLASGAVDSGGGERALVWVVPWTLASLVFAVSSLVLWRRRWPIGRATAWSIVAALVSVLAAAALLAVFGQLGVAGRF